MTAKALGFWRGSSSRLELIKIHQQKGEPWEKGMYPPPHRAHFCLNFSLVAASGGYSLVVMCGLLISVTSLVMVLRVSNTGSVVVTHRF